MEVMLICYWIVACLLGIGLPLLAIVSLIFRKKENRFTRFFVGIRFISECAFVGVFPAIGIALTNDKCGEHPFETASIPSAYTLWLIFALAYFISRDFKKRLSPVALALVAGAMSLGLVFCVLVCIHFIPMAGIVIFPGFNLLYLSPFFSAYFLFKEIVNLNLFFKEKLFISPANSKIEIFHDWLHKHSFGFSALFSLPLVLVIQAILYLFGQRPDSLISQFTDSCGYLLSHYQSCSCGGDHYLCSIAANGNKKLVKPTRFGLRSNQKIIVNRQLLIANAFENWLEDYSPRFHRMIRNSYDAMNIPVNAWSKHRRFANVIYVFMKPLEWLFLVWLYCFDRHPESLIAKQYLPKNELNDFLKNKTI